MRIYIYYNNIFIHTNSQRLVAHIILSCIKLALYTEQNNCYTYRL